MKLRDQIRRLETELKRMRARARDLEITATMPRPHAHNALDFDRDSMHRAMLLFWRHLTPAQRDEYRRQQWFTAIGNLTGAKYRISYGRVGRELALTRITLYCLVLMERSPLEDIMLAKKILIEKDEMLFLRTAVNQGNHPADRWDYFNGFNP